jgi:predicted nucleic acid-binding protein
MVMLVDSSAWVEYLRGTDGDLAIRVRALHEMTSELAITEVVAMELFVGASTSGEEERVLEIMFRSPLLRVDGVADYVQAATLYRTCRRAGETVRKMNDCLVAAVAIRHDVPVLHNDRDFDVLARHTALQVA